MISVIIPAYNEALHLPETLEAVARNSSPHEVIVVDAHSKDLSATVAEECGARVLREAPQHRAKQMNLGAMHARGDILLFLHADTLVSPPALMSIQNALRSDGVVGGAFLRRYASSSLFLMFTCALAGMRSRVSGLFLGDQAMFIRRDLFQSIGGFADIALFEDLDLSLRMRKAGKVVTLRPAVISSARRFEGRGPFRTTLADLNLTWRYLRGEKADDLAGEYRAPDLAKRQAPSPAKTEQIYGSR